MRKPEDHCLFAITNEQTSSKEDAKVKVEETGEKSLLILYIADRTNQQEPSHTRNQNIPVYVLSFCVVQCCYGWCSTVDKSLLALANYVVIGK